MTSKTLNKIFSSRIFYMLFSLLAAIALWMYVEITENEIVPFKVENVQVSFKNKELLNDRSLLIASYSPQKVTLFFEGPRSVISRLSSQNLAAVIDLAGITATGAAYNEYVVTYPDGVDLNLTELTAKSDARITLIVDRKSERPVRVTVEDYRGGTASEDLIADSAIFDPQTIMVSGPDNLISRIKEAIVQIPRESLTTTYTGDLGYVLLDENGEVLDESQLDSITLSAETIHVTIPVRRTKKVPLKVSFVHGAGSTDLNTKVSYDPEFISVAGDPDAIRDLNNIMLTTIDTTRMRDLKTSGSYQIIIPNNVTNLSGETEATVTVELLGMEIGYFSTTNLQVSNIPTGCTPVIINTGLVVSVRGRKEDLNLITDNMSIRVEADLIDMEPGTYQVPAKVYIDGIDADIGAVGEYRITVVLTRDNL